MAVWYPSLLLFFVFHICTSYYICICWHIARCAGWFDRYIFIWFFSHFSNNHINVIIPKNLPLLNLIGFYQGCLFSPTKQTLLQAIKIITSSHGQGWYYQTSINSLKKQLYLQKDIWIRNKKICNQQKSPQIQIQMLSQQMILV